MTGRAILEGGSPGAIRIAAVAAAAAGLALVCLGAGLTGLVAAALVPIVFWIARQDLADFTIPDGAVLALAALGAGFRVADAALADDPLGPAMAMIALDLLVSGGLLLSLREIYYRKRGEDGIGFGDVKLGAAGGVLAGTTGFAWALFAASLAGLALMLALRNSGGRSPPDPGSPAKLPFGAVLAPALWVAWLVGQVPGLSFLGQ
ncbi:MAG: hypothetical protein AVDCRST_MAG90-2800 [uncultured Microvirga sp.]|uniref:Prepilin type IV endopeptidase peptidase domain-containing protein n=1 Tax=uncultured Microvirga sp. TaxID=412392 RepID=A0A6J4M9W3_9HYPH|nr:MAG: hypothetical protein AVDCRST_MAG90-2800 [uncultured Microvirga sp.]